MSTFYLDRTNSKNTGKPFQSALELTLQGYANAGVAYGKHVDPPVRMVGSGFSRKVIFMANPFLDYVGTWTARGGRMIVFEAKSTTGGRLPLCRDGGLTAAQYLAIEEWSKRGAAAFLLWKRDHLVTLWDFTRLKTLVERGDKSLMFDDGVHVPAGAGLIVHDFLLSLSVVL